MYPVHGGAAGGNSRDVTRYLEALPLKVFNPCLGIPAAAPRGTWWGCSLWYWVLFLDVIAMAKQLWENPSNEVGVRKSRFLIVVLYCTDPIEKRRCAGVCLAQRL